VSERGDQCEFLRARACLATASAMASISFLNDEDVLPCVVSTVDEILDASHQEYGIVASCVGAAATAAAGGAHGVSPRRSVARVTTAVEAVLGELLGEAGLAALVALREPGAAWCLVNADTGSFHSVPRDGSLLLGRRRDCELVVECAMVSSRHCAIHSANGVLRVEDLSFNGTFLNGAILEATTELASGDRIALAHPAGPNFVVIRGQASSTPSQRPKTHPHMCFSVTFKGHVM